MASSGAGPAPAQEQGCMSSCFTKLRNMDPATLGLVMKTINLLNASLLAFSGVWVFISSGSELSLLLILAALYVILLLGAWELKLEMCNVCFLKNMGFMFSWRGRLLFFVFVGTLAFGLGLVGIIIGSFTFINAAWNVFIVCYHPEYFDKLKMKADEEVKKAIALEAGRLGMKHAEGAMEDIATKPAEDPMEVKDWEAEQKVNAGEPVPTAGGGGGLPTGWEMRTDEHSGTPYWVNTKTGEQSWEKPT